MIASLVPRTDYASLAECAYLNQASLGLLGQPVVGAMHAFLDDVARHGNLRMSDDQEVSFFEKLRERACRIFHAEPDRIAIVSCASEVLGGVPHLIAPLAGRRIVTVSTDFPAVTRPWLRVAEMRECEVQFVDDDPERDLTSDLIAALDDRTALVAVSAVQYATGTRIDVCRLRDATRQVDARLVVDATQAVGATAVDAAEWNADVVVSSGYKWLGGHGGVVLAVMAPSLLERMPPLPGWMGAPAPFDLDARQVQLAEDARRYTLSTMSYISLIGLTEGIDRLLALGESRIEAHARSLAEKLIERARKLGWQPFRDLSDPAASPHIVSLLRPGAEIGATQDALRSANIITSTRGGRVRVSLAPYNDESDVASLVTALETIPA
jgi:selenocysteine lyase/cysteine desulfurase